MSEILVPPKDIEQKVRRYGNTVLDYAWTFDLPDDLLIYPDHVMIKAANSSDFGRTVKALEPWAEQVAFLEVDHRFLVAAQLIVPMALTDHKPADWIEVMEAKSPDGTADFLGVEYAEFYHEDFNRAGLAMKRKKIPYERRTDGNHQWWNIRMNDEGQEIRITDKPLSEIIGNELENGSARILKAAA